VCIADIGSVAEEVFCEGAADWEYRISGGRRYGGCSPPDAEVISAFMWLKVHQNQHLCVI